jgi:hypothetical protein
MYKEILKLKKMLENASIPFEFIDNVFGEGSKDYQIRLNDDIDVVEHRGSYGNEDDKLEIMGALTIEEMECDSVKGWLTAEEVFTRFKYCYENNTYIYKEE